MIVERQNVYFAKVISSDLSDGSYNLNISQIFHDPTRELDDTTVRYYTHIIAKFVPRDELDDLIEMIIHGLSIEVFLFGEGKSVMDYKYVKNVLYTLMDIADE